jgi:hypothetical protein
LPWEAVFLDAPVCPVPEIHILFSGGTGENEYHEQNLEDEE